MTPKIWEAGGVVVTISTDTWEEMVGWRELKRIGMLKLSDTPGEVIARYGLDDITLGDEVSRPAAFVVDGEGIVRWRYLPESWRFRLSGEEYLEAFLTHSGSRVRPGSSRGR